MKRINFFLVCFFMIGAILGFSTSAQAGWPSAKDVVKAVAPAAGLSPDQVEFVLFALQEPSCASTIVSYTAAQDYSLAIFIAGLKGAKLQSIPEIPKMSHGQCKAYSPMQQAYIFMDTVGGKLASNSGPLKETIKGYIEEGKSSLDAEVASIPYLGTILTNWDCACDAAYMTNFKTEQMVDKTVGDVIAIATFVKSGDIPSALERMVTALGPQVACDLGAAWTGVGSIPVVSDIAAQACSSVAGEVVGWVVSGAGTMAEAIGLVGGEHIPPEEYYAGMYSPHLKDDWREWMPLLYKKCYGYFEPSNMAASTAKKVCAVLQQRFIDENEGREQSAAWQKDPAFKKASLEEQAKTTALMGDDAYKKLVAETDQACETYAAQKYPKLKLYEKNYSTPNFPFDPKYCHVALTMDPARQKAQQNLVYDMVNKQKPFCAKGDQRNTVVCDKNAISACFSEFSNICKKSTMKGGGMEVPCCMVGTAMSDVDKSAADTAHKVAMTEWPYCKTNDSDPLHITCALQESYDHCRKSNKNGWDVPDCAKAEKNPNGTAKAMCCSLDPSWLESVPGVKEAKGQMEALNSQYKDACSLGGVQAGFEYDPRIVNCASGKPLEACVAKQPGECKKLASGFAGAPCCDMSVFKTYTEEKPYDPDSRSSDDLAKTEKVVSGSGGKCHYGTTADGKEDKFKVVCDSIASADMCMKVLDRDARTACSNKISNTGWVTSPCCERSSKALQADLRDAKIDPNGVNAPSAKDMSGMGTDLSVPEKQRAEGPNAHKNTGSRAMGTVKTNLSATPTPNSPPKAPGGLDSKTLGGLGTSGTSGGTSPRGITPRGASSPTSGRATEEDTRGTLSPDFPDGRRSGSSGSTGGMTRSAPAGARGDTSGSGDAGEEGGSYKP